MWQHQNIKAFSVERKQFFCYHLFIFGLIQHESIGTGKIHNKLGCYDLWVMTYDLYLMIFFVVRWCYNEICCFNHFKMRHLKNRSLKKCLVSYQFINLKLFYPQWRNFDRTDMRFLDTGISWTIFYSKILIFKIAYFFNLTHACLVVSIV